MGEDDGPGDAGGAPGGGLATTTGPTGAKGTVETIELSRARRNAARRVAEAKAIVPHVYYDAELDCGPLTKWLERSAGSASLRDALVRAVALALREVPAANGSYRDGNLERHSRVNVGFATQGTDATVYPTILDADRKPIAELASEVAELAGRAERGEITSRELSGATFTVVSVAEPGVRAIAPVVIPPQAAALGAGPPSPAPVVREGRVEAGDVLALTLACDGRAVLDREAAELLAAVRRALCTPELPEL